MEIPYKLYYSSKEQEDNFQDDLAAYKAVITEGTEKDYTNLLLEKYIEHHAFISYDCRFGVWMDRGEEGFPESYNPSVIDTHEIAAYFNSKDEVLENHIVLGDDYTDVLDILSRYFSEVKKELKFNVVRFDNDVKALRNIQSWLTQRKENIKSNTRETDLKESIKDRFIGAIDLKLSSTEVVYFFNELVEKGFIDKPTSQNPLWKMVERYFTASGNKIKNSSGLKREYKKRPNNKPTTDKVGDIDDFIDSQS